jgi:hypothetical protein
LNKRDRSIRLQLAALIAGYDAITDFYGRSAAYWEGRAYALTLEQAGKPAQGASHE